MYQFSICDGSGSASAFKDGVMEVGWVDFQRPVFWWVRFMFLVESVSRFRASLGFGVSRAAIVA